MKKDIRVACLIVRDGKILLIKQKKGLPGEDLDYWIPPGGGLFHTESISDGASREAKEETGFDVRIEKLAYIRHCRSRGHDSHGVEFFFLGTIIGGRLAPEEDPDDDIAEARWFSKKDIQSVRVYPEGLKTELWQDLADGFPEVKDWGLSVF